MTGTFLRSIRSFLVGRRLARSVEQNKQAADHLDAVVREVLSR